MLVMKAYIPTRSNSESISYLDLDEAVLRPVGAGDGCWDVILGGRLVLQLVKSLNCAEVLLKRRVFAGQTRHLLCNLKRRIG